MTTPISAGESWVVCLAPDDFPKGRAVLFGSVVEEKEPGPNGMVSHIRYKWTDDMDSAKIYLCKNDAKMAALFKYPKRDGWIKFCVKLLSMQDDHGNWVHAGAESFEFFPHYEVVE